MAAQAARLDVSGARAPRRLERSIEEAFCLGGILVPEAFGRGEQLGGRVGVTTGRVERVRGFEVRGRRLRRGALELVHGRELPLRLREPRCVRRLRRARRRPLPTRGRPPSPPRTAERSGRAARGRRAWPTRPRRPARSRAQRGPPRPRRGTRGPRRNGAPPRRAAGSARDRSPAASQWSAVSLGSAPRPSSSEASSRWSDRRLGQWVSA